MKRHAPKLMLVIALAALAAAVILPILKHADAFDVKKDYLSHAAFKIDLGPVPGSLLPANILDPVSASLPLERRSFLIHMQKVHPSYKPIGLLIPDLEQEPVNYFVMSYLPPPPPSPDLTGDTHFIDVPPGAEWATLVTKAGVTYRGDLIEQANDMVKFRWRERGGVRPNNPNLLTIPESEVAKLTPAIKPDKVFQEAVTANKKDPWKVAEICCEALNRFGELLKDNVVQVVKQGGIAGPDSPKAILAVSLHPALFGAAPADKIQAYYEMAEQNLAGKTDVASLKILSYLEMQVNKFGDARKNLAIAATNAPNDRSVLHMLAFVQLKMLDAPGALKTYTQLTTTDLDGTDYVAKIGKAMAQSRAGDLDGATNTVTAIKPPVEAFAERSLQALAGAEVAIGLAKLDDAEKSLKTNVQDESTMSRAEMLLGIIAHKKEDDTEALKHFAAATDAKLVRIEPWAWFLYGILTEKSDAAGARTRIENAAKTAPFDPLILLKLGDMATTNKDLVGAEKYYKRAVELDPLDHRAWKRWIQALPQDRKIGTVNTWIDLLKQNGETGAVVWQAQAVRSIFELTAGSEDIARQSAQGVLDQQPDNVAALITTSVLADRSSDETGIKRGLETVLAKTQSAVLSAWALKALNQVYQQAGEHMDYFNLRSEDADHIKWGKTFGSKSGILREYKEDGLTISGTVPDDKSGLLKFGFRIPGKDFLRARITVTTMNGVSEAGIWAGADSTTTAAFKPPTLEVGIAQSQMQSQIYRKDPPQWQPIADDNVRALKAGKDSFDGTTLTYAIDLVDPIRGIFAVTINGQDAGNTSASPLEPDYKLMIMPLSAGGFVRANANLAFKVRFENLIIVSRAGEDAATTAPDAGLTKGASAPEKTP